jgi:hypothetical protein
MSPMKVMLYVLAMGGVIFAAAVAVMLLFFGAAWLWRKLW